MLTNLIKPTCPLGKKEEHDGNFSCLQCWASAPRIFWQSLITVLQGVPGSACSLHVLLLPAIIKPWKFLPQGAEPQLIKLKGGSFTQLPFLEVLATTSFYSVWADGIVTSYLVSTASFFPVFNCHLWLELFSWEAYELKNKWSIEYLFKSTLSGEEILLVLVVEHHFMERHEKALLWLNTVPGEQKEVTSSY